MRAMPAEPTRIEIDGRHLRCHHCEREEFHRRRLRLQTASPSGMQPEWHDTPAQALICAHCGLVHTFQNH